jgi:hypothetical protein
MAKNLMTVWLKLTEREQGAIVFAARRKGYLSQYFTWEEAVAKAVPEILLVSRDVVICALREDAPSYPAAHDALRKLESEPCNSKASR